MRRRTLSSPRLHFSPVLYGTVRKNFKCLVREELKQSSRTKHGASRNSRGRCAKHSLGSVERKRLRVLLPPYRATCSLGCSWTQRPVPCDIGGKRASCPVSMSVRVKRTFGPRGRRAALRAKLPPSRSSPLNGSVASVARCLWFFLRFDRSALGPSLAAATCSISGSRDFFWFGFSSAWQKLFLSHQSGTSPFDARGPVARFFFN